ncbi:MAG: hypothetical protein ACJAWS_002388 [Oleiphilaceae bacterium]|jgi:hypothetical protein
MNKAKVTTLKISFVCLILLLSACTNYEPISVKECKAVAEHTQKVLGKLSPAYNELLKSCEAESDEKRGCIMAATKVGQMIQCNE